MKKILQSLLIFALLFSVAFAQNRTITGTVIDKAGLPVPGVTVKSKGSNAVTSTSANGNFSISVPSSVTIIEFSSLGYVSQSLAIGSTNVVNVALEDSTNDLQEVMVVAYGAVKKESFVGSASTVGAKNFESRPTPSFQKSLQGAAPGIQVSSASGQPGGGTQVRVRGIGSLTQTPNPLYVIDGVPISSTASNTAGGGDLTSVAATADFLATMNPNDIESVTVLKDASASAIYGSRAANGVILITTKQGKAGITKFSATISGGYSSQAVDKHDVLTAEEYYRLYFNSYYATAIAGGATPAAAATTANTNTRNKLVVNPFNTLNPFVGGGTLAPGAALFYDTDWRDAVLRKGITKDANVSASGGTEKLRYYASGGYFDQKGIVIGSDFKRFTGKFNLSNEVNKFLSFGINNTIGNSVQNTPAGAGGAANPVRFADATANIYSLYVRDANGNPTFNASGLPNYSYINPVTPDYNPVGLNDLNQYLSKTIRITSNPYIQVKFLKNFTAKSLVSLDYTTIRENQFYNIEHGDGVAVKGRAYRYSKEDITTTYINTLAYDKSIGQHSVNVLLGQEAFKNRYDSFAAERTGFSIAGQQELGNASLPGSGTTSSVTEERFSSFFSRLNYDYADKYYLSGTFRRDGSSVFGPDNKYGNFWSIGAAWRISQEKFMSNLTFINELKLRASMGTTGNNNIGRYAAQGLYSLTGAYEGAGAAIYSQLANDVLQWEKSKTTDVGLEFSILNRRINGEVAYYKRQSDGLLFAQPLSRMTGFANLPTNLAGINNTGVEVTLGGTPIVTSDFNWNISFNVSTNNNKIKKLTSAEVADGQYMLKVGGDRYAWYLREYAGIDQTDGRAMWYMDDANGNKVTTKTLANAKFYTNHGTALPDFFGGITNTLTYKQFDFSAFTYFSYGGKVYDALEQTLTHNGISVGTQLSREVLNAWSPTNTSSTIPRFMPVNTDLSNSASSRYLHDGSYLRVKNITLGYTLKKDWAAKAKLGNARIYIMAENPFTLAKHKGLDPEQAINGTSNNEIPNIKTLSVGLNIGF
ncbi:TonB-dependent receptor [Pedobacter polaris]|uniref:TonB-dependent receptor n=1 Tax=Pedobacter polaris TaxID=2571273 RepID=A0A4U1CYL4_9SPHI|nr:TonB-dependent receptor [Pedobacter polaris]TKC12739.1 TonB-dependent receptor [Pedobacter polaris]